jgi:class 3 adenylate cyclase
VVNLASRLSDEARDGHTILINQRAHALLEDRLASRPLPNGLVLPGFPGPVTAWHVDRLDEQALVG